MVRTFRAAFLLRRLCLAVWLTLSGRWVYVVGPPDTPYAGGVWKALLRFPDDFPMHPPSVQIMGKFFHPNVRPSLCAIERSDRKADIRQTL